MHSEGLGQPANGYTLSVTIVFGLNYDWESLPMHRSSNRLNDKIHQVTRTAISFQGLTKFTIVDN